jgi:ADP-ribose pyrophosphatase
MPVPENAKKVFKGIMFDVYQWEQLQFDGSYKTFELVKRKDSVQIIATHKNKMILYREEQPFVGKFISLPGGIVETNNPEEDATRELLEETGMTCKELEHWKTTNMSSKVQWQNHYYIARNCEKTQETNLETGEKIEPFFVEFEEFIQTALSDEFRNKEFTYMIMKMKLNNKLEEFKTKIFNK